MELKDFIKTALSDISNAIIESRKDLRDKGVLIEPYWYSGGSDKYHSYITYIAEKNTNASNNYQSLVRMIDFEVNVTIENISSTSGGGKLNVFAASLGGQKDNEASESNVNKIKFSVPIAFEKGG